MSTVEVSPATRIRPIRIDVPGSKSATQRALVCAALADDASILANVSRSEDVLRFMDFLERLGVRFDRDPTGRRLIVTPPVDSSSNGSRAVPSLQAVRGELDSGLSGTALRFVLPLVAATPGSDVVIDGPPRMRSRPIQDLIVALRSCGAEIESLEGEDRLPVRVVGRDLSARSVHVPGTRSSQHPSAMVLATPLFGGDLQVEFGDVPSRGYLDWTVDVAREFGAMVELESAASTRMHVRCARYMARGSTMTVDVSGASYFAAIAAITGSSIELGGHGFHDPLAESAFFDALEAMGCVVRPSRGAIEVNGPKRGSLESIEFDGSRAIDSVPTLAVVAAFARGTTRICGIGPLRDKECDRVAGVLDLLGRFGTEARESKDTLEIEGDPDGPRPSPVEIDPRGDHRIAMAAGVFGARVPAVRIHDSAVVRKSMPEYWSLLKQRGLDVCGVGCTGDELEPEINKRADE